jgi:Ca2+-transporting ATPase
MEKSVFELGFFSNFWVLGGVVAMTLVQVAYTYLPVMNRLFQSAPVDLGVWGRTVAAGMAVFVIIEIEKRLWLKKAVVAA